MKQSDIKQVLDILSSTYGDRHWTQSLDPIGELVQTILSQNTSDNNSRRAFENLINTFGSWEKIAAADISQIAEAIRAGGLADIKARYIKHALEKLKNEAPDFNLNFLKKKGVKYAREWLMRLPGVGMKTASCVLLFSLGMPAFPVDTHVYRVSRRLGILDPRISVDAAHKKLESLIAPQDIYRCHVLLIEHGRKICKAQRPLCNKCTLRNICPQCPS